MLSSRCLLPILAVYVLLEEISAAALGKTFRNKREVGLLDQELLLRVDDQIDLSVGGTGETRSQAFQLETLPLSEHHHQHQHQHQHKASAKRRKVPRVDSIGKFQMSMKQ